MKQLPQISSILYGQPWGILPQNHIELAALYRSYLQGTLQPQAISESGSASYGVEWEADHGTGIAIVSLTGVVTKKAPPMLCGPKLVDLASVDRVLDELDQDSGIRTVVLDFNSPGGVMIGLEETASRMRELAQSKRLIAYTDIQMCSAAYHLAAACDEIYCAPSAVIGSIGVYCAGLDDSRAWELEGLELILAKSGTLKAMGHPGKAWSEEERQWLQDCADRGGVEFRSHVRERRGDVPDEAMQGQWLFAKEADPSLHDGLYRDLPELISELI